MAKKKPDDAPQEAGNGSMTKADAVRAAVAEGKLKPLVACAWIKEKFGIDITPQHFSSYKSSEAKKTGTPGRRGRKPREAAAAPVSAPNGQRVGNRNPAELAKQVKQLVAAFGVDAVRDMTAVFAD
jgi:hypothetical protein